jgi:hypothetical protein
MELETIFSHAVALDQSGRMRNSIFCGDRQIYILNYDKTILLCFKLSSKQFSQPVSFHANDYDSGNFYEKDGKIIFVRQGIEFERKKSCGVPNKTYHDVDNLFTSYLFNQTSEERFELDKTVMELLEEDLSHVEFFSEDKKLVIIQRDVYSGNVVRLDRKPETGLKLLGKKDKFTEDFSPFGIRTNDLIALFTFNRKIEFLIQQGYFFIRGSEASMTGVLSHCLYDDMGKITEVPKYGREIAEDRNSVEKVDRPTCQTKRRKI